MHKSLTMKLYYCLIWSTRDMWVFVKQIDNLFPTFWVFWKSILIFQFVTGQIYLWLETFMFRPTLNHNYFESLKFIFCRKQLGFLRARNPSMEGFPSHENKVIPYSLRNRTHFIPLHSHGQFGDCPQL